MTRENAAVFRVNCSRGATIGGIALAVLLSLPFLAVFCLSSQAPTFFLVVMGALVVLVPGLIVYLTVAGRRMSYEIGRDEFRVKFLTKMRAPYSMIQSVEMVDLTLLLRLFGGSWPGFHWGLFKTSRGNAHVYATKMKGTFILFSLVDGRKIAVTPADPDAFLERILAEQGRFGTATARDLEVSAADSRTMVYAQIAVVCGAFLVFLAYFFRVYPSLPDIVPVHFSFNWVPNRWAPKSELLIMAGLAAVFPAVNGLLALKFGKYEKVLLLFLGIVFVLVEALFLGIVYSIHSLV